MSSADLDINAVNQDARDKPSETEGSPPELPEHSPADELDATLVSLLQERDRLAAERGQFEDLYLRQVAEFQNYRRRAERERTELLQSASMEAVREMLPVVDDLERSLSSECSDKDFYKGIEMIYQRLMQALTKLGLEPLECVGKPFDPNVHHAVERVPTEEAADGTVLAEYQRGYNYRGRALRPAMVRVAVRP